MHYNQFQFDFSNQNYLKFEEDFYQYANINIPLSFLTDDILSVMIRNKINYFRLNKRNAKDLKDHYFFFKIHHIKENKNIILYEYLGHSLYINMK